MLGFIAISNADGEFSALDAPLDKSTAGPYRSIQCNTSPGLLSFHDYPTSTAAAEGRGSRIRICTMLFEKHFVPTLIMAEKGFQCSGVMAQH